jgi:hypothetical protein
MDTRAGNADGVGAGLVGHDSVAGIGQRLGRGADSELALSAPGDTVS